MMRRATLAAALLLIAATARAQPPTDPPPRTAAAMVEGVKDLASAWPAMFTVPGARLSAIRQLNWPGDLWDSRRYGVWFDTKFEPGPNDRADAEALRLPGDEGSRVEFAFEGPGGLVFFPPAEPKPGAPRPRHGAGGRPAALYVHITGRPRPTPKDGGPIVVEIERTWFAVYNPLKGAASPDAKPRALCVVMPGLLGTPEPVVEAMVGTLRRRGYAVVRMLCQPSRFLEKTEIKIDGKNGEARAASEAARLMNARSAECAVSVRDLLLQLIATDHQAWKHLPRAIIGMSGGAMTLPTVVAADPELAAYDAAVLIAGGANLLAICTESNYRGMLDAFHLAWPGIGEDDTPTGPAWDRFNRLYLEGASLDPYHTATLMRGKPTLMIHGSTDRAVPAYLGDLLWERLGKPERWSSTASHELVFAALLGSMTQIGDWIDKSLGLVPQAIPPTNPPAAPAEHPVESGVPAGVGGGK